MTLTDEDTTMGEAFNILADRKGQTYVTNEFAFNMLDHFTEVVYGEFVMERYPHYDLNDQITDADRELALSHALLDKQRSTHEARGILNTYPHQQVVTISDISDIIAEAIGIEPAEGKGAGSGFYADSKHEQNIENIREKLEDELAGDDEAD